MERNTNSVQCFIENGKYVGVFTPRQESDNVSEIVATMTDSYGYFVISDDSGIPQYLTKDTNNVTESNYYGLIITTSAIELDESFNYYLDDDTHTFFTLADSPLIDHESKMENPFSDENMKNKSVMEIIQQMHMSGITMMIQSEDENGVVRERPATASEMVDIVKGMIGSSMPEN